MTGDQQPTGSPVENGAANAEASAPPPPPWRALSHNVALRIFGQDGLDRLRDERTWAVVEVTGPVLAIVVDISHVFGGVASKGFLGFVALFALFLLLAAMRQPWRARLAWPIVFSVVMAMSCGFVSAVQNMTGAEEKGALGKYVPGVEELQTVLKSIFDRLGSIETKLVWESTEAERRQEELLAASAKQSNDVQTVQNFVDKYPNSRFGPDAAALLEKLKRICDQENQWIYFGESLEKTNF